MSVLKLILPIPPSVNKYLYPKTVRNGNKTYVRLAETAESIKYKRKVKPIIKQEIIDQGWTIPDKTSKVDIHVDYYFNKKGMDPNNYLKILYDVFKDVGVYIDDDVAKPQTGMVVIDKYNPRLELIISISKQIGVFKNKEDRDNFISTYENTMPKRSFVALMKKLDESRITLDVYYNEDMGLEMINRE